MSSAWAPGSSAHHSPPSWSRRSSALSSPRPSDTAVGWRWSCEWKDCKRHLVIAVRAVLSPRRARRFFTTEDTEGTEVFHHGGHGGHGGFSPRRIRRARRFSRPRHRKFFTSKVSKKER